MPKYVVSSTLENPEWNNTTVISGDLTTEIPKVREAVDGDVVVHGSAQLVQALIDQGLVDELRLMVYPVVLGDGKRLFGATADKRPLRLKESKTVGDGVEILVYEPAA
jgi:dihydrofolate reductase